MTSQAEHARRILRIRSPAQARAGRTGTGTGPDRVGHADGLAYGQPAWLDAHVGPACSRSC